VNSTARRALVACGALAATALLLVVTRPGPSRAVLPAAEGTRARPAAAHTAAASSHATDHPASAPSAAQDGDRPGPEAAATGGAASDAGGSADGGTADGGGELRSWLDHGRSAVVRVEQPLDRSLSFVERSEGTPNWEAPTPLRFVDLKDHYRAFRRARDFPPETVRALHGAAAIIAGAVMPVDPIVDSGEMRRLWLSNPMIVMAGCVFCSPPTMGDLVLVTASRRPLVVDPERLFRGVVIVKLLGRLRLGPGRTEDGVEYLFAMELERETD
jgi:hypothetical protein